MLATVRAQAVDTWKLGAMSPIVTRALLLAAAGHDLRGRMYEGQFMRMRGMRGLMGAVIAIDSGGCCWRSLASMGKWPATIARLALEALKGSERVSRRRCAANGAADAE